MNAEEKCVLAGADMTAVVLPVIASYGRKTRQMCVPLECWCWLRCSSDALAMCESRVVVQ